MTSAVSKETIDDELWKAGVRSPAVRARLLRIIDIYAVTEGRKYPKEEAIDPDPFHYLAPGEWDALQEITRCEKCGKPKRWALYNIDRKHPTRHKTVCKLCLKDKT